MQLRQKPNWKIRKKDTDEAMNKAIRMVVINTALLEYYSKWHFPFYIFFEDLCKIDFRKDLHLEYSIRMNLLFISDLISKMELGYLKL